MEIVPTFLFCMWLLIQLAVMGGMLVFKFDYSEWKFSHDRTPMLLNIVVYTVPYVLFLVVTAIKGKH